MTLAETLKRLEALGSEKMRSHNVRHGCDLEQFGVKMGDIRTLAKEIKTNHPLALELWGTMNADAMLLATLLVRPKELSESDLEAMVNASTFPQLADWLTSYVVKLHPQKERLRVKWMESDQPMTLRAGWSLTTERVTKNPEGLDPSALLDTIEREAAAAPKVAQWTMNFCLGEIGVNYREHRARAIAIGEKLGMFRDYPVSKGCTSPYVPIWVAALGK